MYSGPLNPIAIGSDGSAREKTIVELVTDAQRSLENAETLFRQLAGALVGNNRPIYGESNYVRAIEEDSVRGRALDLDRGLAAFAKEIEDVKRAVYGAGD